MKDHEYGSSYIERLKHRREIIQAHKDAQPNPLTLTEQIEAWYQSLPEEDQKRAYTMKEFKIILNDTPQKIGDALWSLGWKRKRIWRDDQPTARFWTKF